MFYVFSLFFLLFVLLYELHINTQMKGTVNFTAVLRVLTRCDWNKFSRLPISRAGNLMFANES